jgi:hypothetical protein
LRSSTPAEADVSSWRRRPVPRLILGSALMLFLELALIRWLGAKHRAPVVLHQLRAAGLVPRYRVGFLISRKAWSVLPWTPVVLALLVVAVRLFPVSVDRAGADVIFFTALDTTGPRFLAAFLLKPRDALVA